MRIYLRLYFVTKHAQFNEKRVQEGFDISLLILDQEVSFSNYIQAACLPDNNTLYPAVNSAGAIAGWGLTDVFFEMLPLNLRNVKVNVADETTKIRCSMLGSFNSSILCLGFYILCLSLEIHSNL